MGKTPAFHSEYRRIGYRNPETGDKICPLDETEIFLIKNAVRQTDVHRKKVYGFHVCSTLGYLPLYPLPPLSLLLILLPNPLCVLRKPFCKQN